MLRDKKLAVIGAGKLGETLIKGLIEAGVIEVSNVIITAGHQARLDRMRERFGVTGTLSNGMAAESADIIILAVKPQTVPSVLSEIKASLRPSQLLISVAASVSAAFIEKHLDTDVPVVITGLSAMGPVFIFIIIESRDEACVKVVVALDISTELAAQTVVGAGSMVLETAEHPAKLKDMVTTPAGCTIDGILELEDGGLRVTLIKAVVKATHRAKELLET